MKKIFSLLLLVLVTSLSFADSVQIATLPLMGNRTVAIVVDGTGVIFIRLSEKGMTIRPSEALGMNSYLNRFIQVDAENPKPNVTLTELLGARAFMPLVPAKGKLFMVASVSKDRGNAMGFRLVDFANMGGWGQDETYYMEPATVKLFKQALQDAVEKEQDLRREITRIQETILAAIN